MKRFGWLVSAIGLAFAPAAQSEMFKDGDVVCFFGDSITHGGQYHQIIYDYYLTRFPDRKIYFYNSGISGDSAGGAQGRFPEDVTAHHPTAVTVMFGMNDIGRGNYVSEPSASQLAAQEHAYQNYQKNMQKIVARLRTEAGNPAVYYFTPTPFDDTVVITNTENNFPGCNAALGQCAEFIRATCAANHGTLVDFYNAFDAFNRAGQTKNPMFTIIGPDRVHPRAQGHLLMAWVFLKAQNADGLVSVARLHAGTLAPHPFTANATFSNIQKLPAGLSFTLTEKALPFPIAPEAMPLLDQLPILRDLNREMLAVTGLAAGTYTLTIDGQEVGAWSANELAAGINLAFNEKTPQFLQAQAVRRANAERRNTECKLRNLAAVRWFLGNRLNVNDFAAVKDYVENQMANKTGFFETLALSYVQVWPKHDQIQQQLDRQVEALFALRQPHPHAYQLLKK